MGLEYLGGEFWNLEAGESVTDGRGTLTGPRLVKVRRTDTGFTVEDSDNNKVYPTGVHFRDVVRVERPKDRGKDKK